LPEHYQGWSFETDQRGQVLVARDDQARQRWRLTRGISRPEEQFLSAGPQRVTFHDRLVGWSNGHRLLIAADVEPERNPPRILWEESLAPTPLSSGNGVVAIPAPQGRIVVNRGAGNVFRQDALPGTTGILAAITDSAVIYHNGRKLFAADPLTGRLLWSRTDLPRIPFQVAADDQVVAVAGLSHPLAPALGSVTLLRTSNGEQIGTVDAPVGVIEWIGGGRVLRSEDPSRPSTGPMPLELYDLVRGETIWKTELARPAAIRVWNQSEVFALEENRRLTVRSATDGAVRWTQELSLEVAAEALFVQPWKDRYLIVVGSTSPPPAQPGSARVVGFDNHHVPINGHVAALNRRSGEILWTHRVEDTAFDTSQPAGWPILLFAGRMYITPRAPAAPLPSYLTTTLFDKQTGKLIISVEEPSNIGTYFVDADPDRNRISVNFLTWSGDMRYTGRKE
jgi:outer membrane protein assembly factor BamB